MTTYANRKTRLQNSRNTPGEKVRFYVLLGVAAAILAGTMILCLGLHAWGVFDRIPAEARNASTNTLSIELRCDGWTEEMVDLGVFVSGITAQGDPVEEQLMFHGSGTQALTLESGQYAAVAQFPQVMAADGFIWQASEPASFLLENEREEEAFVLVEYKQADKESFSEEERVQIEQASLLETGTLAGGDLE